MGGGLYVLCVLLGSVRVAASCMKRLLTTGSGGGLRTNTL